jgi:hypothetical protein
MKEVSDARAEASMTNARKAAEFTRYDGSCHCGAVGFSYRTGQVPSAWSLRACQCSFCRAHAALSTSDRSGQVEFRESVSGALNRYRFGQRTAEFLLCRECGVYIGALMETPRGRFGIVNVNALRPVPSELAPAVPMDYGSESREQRIARREQRWSPVVSAAV